MVLISSPVLLNKQPPAGVENLTSLLIQTLIFFTHKQEVCDVTKSEIYAGHDQRRPKSQIMVFHQTNRTSLSISVIFHQIQFSSQGPEKSTS